MRHPSSRAASDSRRLAVIFVIAALLAAVGIALAQSSPAASMAARQYTPPPAPDYLIFDATATLSADRKQVTLTGKVECPAAGSFQLVVRQVQGRVIVEGYAYAYLDIGSCVDGMGAFSVTTDPLWGSLAFRPGTATELTSFFNYYSGRSITDGGTIRLK